MNTVRTMLRVCCSLAFVAQLLQAAPPQGWVVGWGSNISGEATGTPSYQFTNGVLEMTGSTVATGLVTIADMGLSNAVMISAGTFRSLALRSDTTVVGWGGDLFGEVMGEKIPYPGRTNGVVKVNGQILSNVVSIAASRTFSVALKQDGTLVTWGENQVPAGATNIKAIVAAHFACLALKDDGTLVEWHSQKGLPQSSQLRVIPEVSDVVAIAMGESQHGTRPVALKKDGTVVRWGTESIYNDATLPAGLSNVVAVAAGCNHSLALKKDGTVVGWGFNSVGQATGVPNTNFISVSIGQVIIEQQVLSNIVSVAAGREYSLALKKDGTVVAWGGVEGTYRSPVIVPKGLSNVVAIAAGDYFCLAITTNKAVADKFSKAGR